MPESPVPASELLRGRAESLLAAPHVDTHWEAEASGVLRELLDENERLREKTDA